MAPAASSLDPGGGQPRVVQLSGEGVVAFQLPCPSSQQILQLRVQDTGALGAMWLERWPVQSPRKPPFLATGPFEDQVISLPLAGAATGAEAGRLCRLVLRGQPGAEITLMPVDWQPISLLTRLDGMFDDWFTARAWGLASINFHSTVVQAWHGLSPNVVLGLLFISLGIVGYWRWRTRFLLWWMLACWLLLDLPWQWRLLEQATATGKQFASLPAQSRPGATADALRWRFAERVVARVSAADSRVFVASASDYGGMRMAYYLYPLNVYWRRGGPELPASSTVRAGDFIVVVQPSNVRGDPESGHLLFGDERWSARPLLEADGIVLFEVL
tara:strand:- start:2 stop:991 length:990 start_codon:yes stop_codon:yes gene_type:complete